MQISNDGGGTWKKVDKLPGLPEYGSYGVYVQRLHASKHDENTVYALFENSKNGDFKPYIYKSTDKGATWTSIAGDLPTNGPTLGFAEDHVNRDLLFCGTEFGLFFTVDGGKKWVRLRGNLPTIPVRDLAIQERENDLVLATFGRGFYVLDDYSPLRSVTPAVFQKDGHVFPISPAVIEVSETGKSRGSQGEQHWMGENRPVGAIVSYWVKDAPKTLKQRRQEAARAADEKKDAAKYPSQAELTAEADEDAPQTFLTITDAAGKVVRRLSVPGARGIHRYVWNLRATAPTTQGGRFGGGDADQEPTVFQGGTGGGSFVVPGTYTVSLSRRANGAVTALGEPQTVVVKVDPAAPSAPVATTAALEFQEKVARLQRTFAGASEQATHIKSRTTAIKRALVDSPADVKLLDEAVSLDKRATDIGRQLRGDETLRGLESGSPSSIQSRVMSAAAGSRGLTGAPTGTQQMNHTIAAEQLAAEVAKLKALEADLRKFELQLEAAGVPYTPGRWPQ